MLSKWLVGCNIHCSFLMRRAHAFHAATRSKIPSGSGLSAWGWFGMLEPWFHAHFWRGSSIFGCRFAWTLLVKPIGYWLTPVRGTWKLGAHTTLIFPCAYDLLWRLFLYICLFCSVYGFVVRYLYETDFWWVSDWAIPNPPDVGPAAAAICFFSEAARCIDFRPTHGSSLNPKVSWPALLHVAKI